MEDSQMIKFTMRLWRTHSEMLRELSRKEGRSQSIYIRAAIHNFLNLSTEEKREKVINDYLKAHRV